MNALLLRAWLAENAPTLVGARLRDVRQVDAKSFALQLGLRVGAEHMLGPQGTAAHDSPAPASSTPTQRAERVLGPYGTSWLFVSILEGYPVLALLADDDPLLAADFPEGNFVKALRFHLAGGTLAEVQQEGFDRSVGFVFAQKDMYGREARKCLRVELVGRASNAYLLSERSMVVSILKRVPPGRNTVRRVQTGKALPPPPPLGKYIAAEGDAAAMARELAAAVESAADGDAVRELLTRRVAGGDVHLWPRLAPLVPAGADAAALQDFVARMQAGALTAELFGLQGHSANSAALAQWQTVRGAQPQQRQKGEASTDDPRRAQLEQQLALARRADELNRLGLEMLQRSFSAREQEAAYLRGWQAANPDWAQRIDITKSTEDNAGQLIEYAQRLSRALPRLVELLAEAKTVGVDRRVHPNGGETSGADTPVRPYLEDGADTSLREVQGRRPAAAATDPLSTDVAKLQKGDVKYLRFVSSDGVHILVGQSDRSNDELVRLYGSSRHLWLHVRDYPGSHVILLSGGREVPERTLREAAVIAGYYSQGRGETDLDISYTPLKQLRRPKGGKPGQVLKLSEKVVSVNPMLFEELREKLRYDGGR